MKLFKSKSEKESVKTLIRDFFNFQECILNHGTDKIESDIESLKVRVHRLECSSSSANNVDTFAGKTKNELNDCIKDYDLKISRMLAIAFEAGAEWQSNQSSWISVEKRLPEKPEYDWVLVIVRDKRDGFIGIPQIGELRSDGFWHTVTSDSFNTPDFMRIYNTTDVLGELLKQEVVAWMPIPSFDEILEANKDVLKRIKEKGD